MASNRGVAYMKPGEVEIQSEKRRDHRGVEYVHGRAAENALAQRSRASGDVPGSERPPAASI